MSNSTQGGKWGHFQFEVSSVKYYSCKNCDHRHPVCWSTCPEYQEEKKKYDEERARRQEMRRKEDDITKVALKRRGTRQ